MEEITHGQDPVQQPTEAEAAATVTEVPAIPASTTEETATPVEEVVESSEQASAA